jgi:hypothetical protein
VIRRFARKTPEHDFQKQVAQYLNFALPQDAWWTSIDHAGGGRLAGALRKVRGVKSGLADVWVVWRGQLRCFELKAPGGRPSDDQIQNAHQLSHAGVTTHTVTQLAVIEAVLADWGIPLRARLTAEPAAVKAARSTA